VTGSIGEGHVAGGEWSTPVFGVGIGAAGGPGFTLPRP
jgi:hypothetical protein